MFALLKKDLLYITRRKTAIISMIVLVLAYIIVRISEQSARIHEGLMVHGAVFYDTPSIFVMIGLLLFISVILDRNMSQKMMIPVQKKTYVLEKMVLFLLIGVAFLLIGEGANIIIDNALSGHNLRDQYAFGTFWYAVSTLSWMTLPFATLFFPDDTWTVLHAVVCVLSFIVLILVIVVIDGFSFCGLYIDDQNGFIMWCVVFRPIIYVRMLLMPFVSYFIGIKSGNSMNENKEFSRIKNGSSRE